MEKTDVLIVGAGVAGLFTALNLDSRYRAIILEKQPFPPHKLCAGLLCDDAYRIIKPFSPPETLFYQPQLIKARIVDKDNDICFPVRDQFHNLNREQLYTWFSGLLKANVTLLQQTRFLSATRENGFFLVSAADPKGRQLQFKTRYLVGADGFHSRVRRLFYNNIRPDFVHSVQYTVKQDGSLNEMQFLFKQALCAGYYIWIIPRDDTIILGTAMEGKNYLSLPAFLKQEYGLAWQLTARGGHPITKVAATSQITPGNGNLLLTGEAAGMVRPSSGEGISLALKSGLYAAVALRDAPDDPCAAYTVLCSGIYSLVKHDLKNAAVLFDPQLRKKFLGR